MEGRLRLAISAAIHRQLESDDDCCWTLARMSLRDEARRRETQSVGCRSGLAILICKQSRGAMGSGAGLVTPGYFCYIALESPSPLQTHTREDFVLSLTSQSFLLALNNLSISFTLLSLEDLFIVPTQKHILEELIFRNSVPAALAYRPPTTA